MVLLASCGAPGPPFDVLFVSGTLVDGSGAQARVADVGVRDGRIAAVGDLQGAAALETIDIGGLVIAPGFIDAHSHAEEGLVDPALRTNAGFVTQGVTTSVFGNDGAHSLDDLRQGRETFDRQGVGTNYAFFVGHNGIRRQVMGMDDRAPTEDELERMKSLVRKAMEEGSMGLSTGLMYLPGNFATTDEVVELAKMAAPFGGIYDSHIRDPAHELLASLEEAIEIGERAGLVPHPAHVKAVASANFGKGPGIVSLVEAARARGLEVTVDQYPYDGAAAANLVNILLAPEEMGMEEGQRQAMEMAATERDAALLAWSDEWRELLSDASTRKRIQELTENPPTGLYSWVDAVGYGSFRIVVTDRAEYRDRMVVDVAAELGLEPFDVIADLIVEEGGLPKITLGAIQEEDVRILMKQPWVMVASDGSITGFEAGQGHPRYRGTFPRVLGRYVREWGVLELEDAVRKMTSLPAEYLRLADRGLVQLGNAADLTVFDPDSIIDRSTWAEPSLFSEGVVHVLVNGGFALRDGEMTGETHGVFLPFRSAGKG